MKVQAEVSLYPLRTQDLAEPIWEFTRSLTQDGVKIDTGPMSTHITGECNKIMECLGQAFIGIAKKHQVVMTMKVLSEPAEALIPDK